MGLIICFLFWGALCVRAVLRGRMLLWTGLCLGPLGLIAFSWWWDHAGRTQPLEDPFGLQGPQMLAFVAMSLITASTGVLSLVVSASWASPIPPVPAREARRPARRRYTLWQRLWWKPVPKAD
jgi:hypothetical protein